MVHRTDTCCADCYAVSAVHIQECVAGKQLSCTRSGVFALQRLSLGKESRKNEVKQGDLSGTIVHLYLLLRCYEEKESTVKMPCYLSGLITRVIRLFHAKCSINTALEFEIIKHSGSTLRHKAYLSTCLHLVLVILSYITQK